MDKKQERINNLVRLTNGLVYIVYSSLAATVFVGYNEVSSSLIECINTICNLLKELGYSDVFVNFMKDNDVYIESDSVSGFYTLYSPFACVCFDSVKLVDSKIEFYQVDRDEITETLVRTLDSNPFILAKLRQQKFLP